jgi:hypothetical protein
MVTGACLKHSEYMYNYIYIILMNVSGVKHDLVETKIKLCIFLDCVYYNRVQTNCIRRAIGTKSYLSCCFVSVQKENKTTHKLTYFSSICG